LNIRKWLHNFATDLLIDVMFGSRQAWIQDSVAQDQDQDSDAQKSKPRPRPNQTWHITGM